MELRESNGGKRAIAKEIVHIQKCVAELYHASKNALGGYKS